jgi:membrane protein DedA with SNARE-associated domain
LNALPSRSTEIKGRCALQDISGLIEHYPYLGLFALLILGGIGFPFPEDTTLILCGFLISAGIVKSVPALVIVYSSLLTTDFLLYLFGKKYGRRIVTHKRFRKTITPERLSLLENAFRKRGVLVILVGRHLAGLRAQIFLAAGVMRMSAITFLIADAVSSILTIGLMVGAGYIGGHSLQVIRKDITRLEHVAIVFGILVFSAYAVFRYIRAKQHRGSP